MKQKKLLALVLALLLLAAAPSCGDAPQADAPPSQPEDTQPSQPPDAPEDPGYGADYAAWPPKMNHGEIYFYGETHGNQEILQKELALWNTYYHEQGLRHLFIELPCFTAGFLNLWMQSDSDEILDQIYADWEGTLAHNPLVLDFYKQIKRQCPETVFHGTDLGHQYNSTGRRFLQYLADSGQEGSALYWEAAAAMDQGMAYYSCDGEVGRFYRENAMALNFIRAFDKLDGESVVGFYGGAHVEPQMYEGFANMAVQLGWHYGENLHTEDLSQNLLEEPLGTDTFEINGKAYQASYFGQQDLSGGTLADRYASREFWRLEDAWEDFQAWKKTGNVMPYNNYPMAIEEEQVFMVAYHPVDGAAFNEFYISGGRIWEGFPSTEQVVWE